jgi:hypothetical protein
MNEILMKGGRTAALAREMMWQWRCGDCDGWVDGLVELKSYARYHDVR